MEQCKSRITLESLKVPFGDKKHYFYIGIRCEGDVVDGREYCRHCLQKTPTITQTSKKYNHGDIDQKIPGTSHIYGGEWYNNSVKKYLVPSSETIKIINNYTTYKDNRYDSVEMSEKKTSLKRKIKIIRKKINVEPNSTIVCGLVERDGAELDVDEVVFVKVASFEHNGVHYYRNRDKEKLYRRDVDGVVGQYVGRWDDVRKEICQSVVDSDNEGNDE